MHAGLIGASIGIFLGLAGGVIGTYVSIKNARGPRERFFVKRYSSIAWSGITVFLLLFFLLPRPYNYFVWVPYGFLLTLGISYANRKQLLIRNQESKANG